MSLSSDIQGIVSNLSPDSTYILSNWFKANVKSYRLEEMSAAKPFIILDNEQPEDIEIQRNLNYLVNTQIKMWFLVKSNIYDNPEEMEADLDSIKPLVYQVANNIYQLDSIRLKGSELAKFKMIKRFKVFNSALVGWEFIANWKYNEVANWCKS